MIKCILVGLAALLTAAIPAQAASSQSHEQPTDQANQAKVIQNVEIAGFILSE
jgi:hypothetical protein